MAIKQFVTGEVLTAGDTNTYLANGGLVYINTTNIGTSVASVTTPAGSFSADFDSYRIVMSNVSASTNNDVLMQLNTGGTPATGANYSRGYVYVSYPSTVLGFGQNNATYFVMSSVSGASQKHMFICDLLDPFKASPTGFWTTAYMQRTDIAAASGSGYHTLSTSYDRITLTTSSGNITGGTITVYGYRKA